MKHVSIRYMLELEITFIFITACWRPSWGAQRLPRDYVVRGYNLIVTCIKLVYTLLSQSKVAGPFTDYIFGSDHNYGVSMTAMKTMMYGTYCLACCAII